MILFNQRGLTLILLVTLILSGCDRIYTIVNNQSDTAILVRVTYGGGSSESVLPPHKPFLKMGWAPPFDIAIRDSGPQHHLLYSGKTCMRLKPLIISSDLAAGCDK